MTRQKTTYKQYQPENLLNGSLFPHELAILMVRGMLGLRVQKSI